MLLLNPFLSVANLVDDCDFRLLGDFFIVVVLSLWMRGRLGDGAFDRGLKVIVRVWRPLEHAHLAATNFLDHHGVYVTH